ncbi:hypothetical protein NQ315_001412 [Exocentrus adspersus]|uniref:Fibronectin type-III domain-containing protein n=1 Tax=Exocentrus adspersus TaxID=1586481 RepID=A0AAV8WHK2_9CUCU|nr:hypothetical protein NQ315_001412 [Exocentrus adspersus]
MVFRYLILGVTALSCFVHNVKADDCIPGNVLNLKIHVDGNLTWSVNPTEPCTVDSFQVDVEGDREDSYHVRVYRTFVDLSFLKTCEQWRFVVTPVSRGIFGHAIRLIDWIPLPANSDLSLDYFNLTVVGRNDVLARWELKNRTHGDCTLGYRVAITDRTTSLIRDVYVTGRSTHLNLSPCVPYHITIRAVNVAIGGIEGPLLSQFLEIPAFPEDPPQLRDIHVGPTYIHTTWRLENFIRNRCPVQNFYLDCGALFNYTLVVDDPDGRPPVRVNVTGLQPNTIYYLKASVENSGGISDSVSLAVQTLELDPGAA